MTQHLLPHNTTETSRAAARTAAGRSNRDAAHIQAFILQRGIQGATCDEVEVELDLSHTTASARMAEMRGVCGTRPITLLATTMKRRTRKGCMAEVVVDVSLIGMVEVRPNVLSKGRLRHMLREVLAMATPIPDKDSSYVPNALLKTIRNLVGE